MLAVAAVIKQARQRGASERALASLRAAAQSDMRTAAAAKAPLGARGDASPSHERHPRWVALSRRDIGKAKCVAVAGGGGQVHQH
jgi:hypothetical protein